VSTAQPLYGLKSARPAFERRVLAIVPAYNEEACIHRTVAEILHCGTDVDVLVIDDGSTDRTFRQASEAGAQVLRLPVNLGIGGAMQAGYLQAVRGGYGYAIQLDGDGQHPAPEIQRLLDCLQERDVDMVIGSRFLGNGGFRSTVTRRMGIRFFSWLLRWLTGRRYTDPASGFRLVNRRAMELFARQYPEDYPEPESILLCCRHGLQVEEIPVTMRPRETGTSSIRSFRVLYYMTKVTLSLLMCRLRLWEQPSVR
jgi:glycosyltransferase involved in cell wall biosynthesis